MKLRGTLAVCSFVMIAACDGSTALPLPSAGVIGPGSVPVRVAGNTKIDVLFMVDNSSSMAPMQNQLKARFGELFASFGGLADLGIYPDLHIGVVTSDYGAGPVAGGDCEASPGGQKGHLQQLGRAAAAGCEGPADSYISFAFGPGGASTSNLPGASDLATLTQTFTCMASGISDDGEIFGCGFEHPLESVYAALHDTDANAGFLRDDALLAVVFLTNEDDGSAPPTATFYQTDLDASFGSYTSFRQTRYGVDCGSPEQPVPYAASMGPLLGCEPGGAKGLLGERAYDVARYIDFFTRPKAQGGVKANPNDVILVAIDAPATPFETILATIDSGAGVAPSPAFEPCDAVSLGQCEVRLQHSCQNASAPAFYGDPAVRLNAVVEASRLHQIASICGDDPTQLPDYATAMQRVSSLLVTNMFGGCVTGSVADPTAPDCVAMDVVPSASGNRETAIPSCAGSNGATPCWRPSTTPACASASPQSLAIDIERAGVPAPAGSYVDASCQVQQAG